MKRHLYNYIIEYFEFKEPFTIFAEDRNYIK